MRGMSSPFFFSLLSFHNFKSVFHQQNIPSHIYKYIPTYSNKVIVNFEIQAAKYLLIQVTSKTQSTTRNVYSTIHATVYKVLHKMSGIQEHVLSPRGLYYLKWLKKVFFFSMHFNLIYFTSLQQPSNYHLINK